MESIAFALIAIAFITAGFFVWYFTFKARQEERRFLIEKGYKLEELPEGGMSITFPWRKTGIVLVAGMLSMWLHELTFNLYQGELPALILGAGVGMILANAIENGYSVRSFWRTVLYGFLGFAISGVGLSIADSMMVVHEALMIFILILSVAVALIIELRTRKA